MYKFNIVSTCPIFYPSNSFIWLALSNADTCHCSFYLIDWFFIPIFPFGSILGSITLFSLNFMLLDVSSKGLVISSTLLIFSFRLIIGLLASSIHLSPLYDCWSFFLFWSFYQFIFKWHINMIIQHTFGVPSDVFMHAYILYCLKQFKYIHLFKYLTFLYDEHLNNFYCYVLNT